MFTETEALVLIKFLKEQREQTERMRPEDGPAQTAWFMLIRVATLLAVDSGLSIKDVAQEIVPRPTEIIL